MKKEFKITDIKDLKTFTKYGDIFTFERHYPETNTYLYKRVSKETGNFKCWELVRPIKIHNSEMNYIYTYPSSEKWGLRGLTLYQERYIDLLALDPDWSPEHRYELKKETKHLE